MVVAAVWFDPPAFAGMGRLDDSKRLSPAAREALASAILRSARVAVYAAAAPLIDRRGIRSATLDAMAQAIKRLGMDAPVRVDGLDVPAGLDFEVQAVVQGARRIPQIAAASIMAKVVRDRLLRSLGRRYPQFGWEENMGYATEAHLEALRRLGPTAHHRRSFTPASGQLYLEI